MEAACVVATAVHSGHSVGFYGGHPSGVPRMTRKITYVRTELTQAHVRASAAIPFIFIDSAEPEPRLIECLAGDNPLRNAGDGTTVSA